MLQLEFIFKAALTRILNELLQRLLKPPDVKGLRSHAHERHDLEELLLAGLAKLVDVVATWVGKNSCYSGKKLLYEKMNTKPNHIMYSNRQFYSFGNMTQLDRSLNIDL